LVKWVLAAMMKIGIHSLVPRYPLIEKLTGVRYDSLVGYAMLRPIQLPGG
jgi:hypothetical protein